MPQGTHIFEHLQSPVNRRHLWAILLVRQGGDISFGPGASPHGRRRTCSNPKFAELPNNPSPPTFPHRPFTANDPISPSSRTPIPPRSPSEATCRAAMPDLGLWRTETIDRAHTMGTPVRLFGGKVTSTGGRARVTGSRAPIFLHLPSSTYLPPPTTPSRQAAAHQYRPEAPPRPLAVRQCLISASGAPKPSTERTQWALPCACLARRGACQICLGRRKGW